MEAKHTPGPWQSIGQWNDEWDGVLIKGDGVTVALASYIGGTEQAKINARLIAAAPDLLSALEAALPFLTFAATQYEAKGNLPHSAECIGVARQARAALQKARQP